MVIRKEDRVSTVLRHDESLIEVFVALSPAFERLRNRGMRKVMSRLVTVEQAARIAGVDADELVGRLNAAPRDGAPGEAAPVPDPAGSRDPGAPERGNAGSLPAALAAIEPGAVVQLDVREDLRSGREPFSRIMAARRRVPEGGALCLRAIFEPVPLYAVMAKQGLAHHTERLGPEDWRVWFYVPADEPAPAAPSTTRPEAGPAVKTGAPEEDVVVLDVRGLEPPEPMERTLAALATLPAGATLVQLNVRVPRFLLPLLEERGFTHEIRDQAPDLVRVFIRRPADGAPAIDNDGVEG